MIKAIIIDEEPKNADKLLQLLKVKYAEIQVVSVVSTVEVALLEVIQLGPNLVFLSIGLFNSIQFNLFNKLKQTDFKLVFTKTWSQQNYPSGNGHPQIYFMSIGIPGETRLDHRSALQSKNVNVLSLKSDATLSRTTNTGSNVNYLNQPFKPVFLKNTLNEITMKQVFEVEKGEEAAMIQKNNQNLEFHRLALPTMDGYDIVTIKSIIRCEGEGSYSRVYLSERKNVMVCRNLKELSRLLTGHNFCRIHHSHLINMEHVKKYFKGEGGFVNMSNKDTIPVSKRKKGAFIQMLTVL